MDMLVAAGNGCPNAHVINERMSWRSRPEDKNDGLYLTVLVEYKLDSAAAILSDASEIM